MTPENALYRAAALCSKSEQAEADIRKKLATWEISADDADQIINRLISEKYLDETRYAHAYVRDKFRFGGWGRTKIAYSLRQKHISATAIEDALTEIDEQEYFDTLKIALMSKLRTIRDKDPLKLRASLFRFAASRGFEPAVISKAMNSILKNSTDDEFEPPQEDIF